MSKALNTHAEVLYAWWDSESEGLNRLRLLWIWSIAENFDLFPTFETKTMKTTKQLLRNLMEDCIPVIRKGKENCKVCLKAQCF